MTEEANAQAVEPAAAPEVDSATPPAPAEPTPRESIERAFKAVDKMEAEPAKEPAKEPEKGEKPKEAKAEKPEAKEGRERNPDGTFKSKDGDKEPAKEEPKAEKPKEAKPEEKKPDEAKEAKDDKKQPDGFTEPPKRFSEDAKTSWKDAPLSVRAEIRRMERELGQGLQQYKADAESFAEFKDFAAELKQNGQKFQDVVNNYKGIEALLAKDPIQGLDTICRNMGTTLADVAQKVTSQTPDQATQQQQNVAYDLRQENNALQQKIQRLEEQVTGVQTTVATQAETAAMNQINEFASRPENSRFEELSGDISLFLQNGRAADLPEAYALAERLNPAPAPQTPPAPASEAEPPAQQAQTQKGQLSPTGAPGSGSNPANRKRSESARDSLKYAFGQVGL